jgi:UDPglucose 6-dehydrogenase
MVRTMFNTVSDKRIAIWGFAFKKDTNDTRESAAIYVCRDLLEERAKLSIYDPRVTESQIRAELEQAMLGPDGRLSPTAERLLAENIEVATSAHAAANRAHAIALLTEWDEFRSLDFHAVYQHMHKPAFIFDGRNLLKSYQLHKLGFRYQAIGST